jgi:hypothetical protein
MNLPVTSCAKSSSGTNTAFGPRERTNSTVRLVSSSLANQARAAKLHADDEICGQLRATPAHMCLVRLGGSEAQLKLEHHDSQAIPLGEMAEHFVLDSTTRRP